MRLLPVLVLSALLLPACGDEEDEDEGSVDPGRIEAILQLDRDAAAGEAVFARCTNSSCHGTDGDSGPGAKLSVEVPEESDEELIEIVLGGEEEMPPQDLTDQEMADLLAYLRQTFG